MSTGTRRDQYNPVAESIPFDNSTNEFESDDVQSAIEESFSAAAPPWSFARNGSVNQGTYLYRTGQLPSNNTGVTIGLQGATVKQLLIGCTNLTAFDIDIIEHDGNNTNITLISTVSIPGGAYRYTIPRTDVLTFNRVLAVRVSPTSPNKPSDVAVDFVLSGSFT